MANCVFELYDDGNVVVGPGELDQNMFRLLNKAAIKSIEFTGPITAPRDCNRMFRNMTALEEIKGLENFDTSKVTSMRYMFGSCHALKKIDLSSFDTSQVTDMQGMFSNCVSLSAIDLSSFDTSKVTDMSLMFNDCLNLAKIGLSQLNTSHVTDMSFMFFACQSLPALDVSNFNTSKVNNMNCMFTACRTLSDLDLSGFNMSGVTNKFNMFEECPASVMWQSNLNITANDMETDFLAKNGYTDLRDATFVPDGQTLDTESFLEAHRYAQENDIPFARVLAATEVTASLAARWDDAQLPALAKYFDWDSGLMDKAKLRDELLGNSSAVCELLVDAARETKDFTLINTIEKIVSHIDCVGEMSLREYLIENGVPASQIHHHDSDLYVKEAPGRKELIEAFISEGAVYMDRFVDAIDKDPSFDIPFGYFPEWMQVKESKYLSPFAFHETPMKVKAQEAPAIEAAQKAAKTAQDRAAAVPQQSKPAR